MSTKLAELHVLSSSRAQPVEVQRLDLVAPFTGWWVDVDANVEVGAMEDLGSKDMQRIGDALGSIVVAWNFVDKHGEPIPCTREGCRKISKALLTAFLLQFNALFTLPNV